MRKLYNEFFYVPKHEKIRENVMVTRVAMTIIIMVMCLAVMSLTAYAFFSYNVTSGLNTIKAATFEADVQVQITDNNGKAVANSQITPITSDHKKFRIDGLEVGKYYTVTITPTEQSTAKTGFVIVTADNCNDTYHTQQLAKDVNTQSGVTSSITFKMMITGNTSVYLQTHWGTSSYYGYPTENNEHYIQNGETVTLSIQGAANVKSSANSTETTSSKTETASTVESTSSASAAESSTASTSETSQPEETEATESATSSETADLSEESSTVQLTEQ